MKYLVVFLISFNVSAHFELGVYEGLTESGVPCWIDLKEKKFKNQVKHPLNEIVNVTTNFNQSELSLRHPFRLLGTPTAKVLITKGILEGAYGDSSGMQVVRLVIAHEEDYQGPVSFSYLSASTKGTSRRLEQCESLKHKPY